MNKAVSAVTNNPQFMLIAIGSVVGLFVVYKLFNYGEKAAGAVADAAKAVATNVNPASQENIVQKLGTAVVRAADQKNAQQELTLSTWLVDKFDLGGVNSYDPNADVKVTTTKKTGALK